jgi:hypothetical protein
VQVGALWWMVVCAVAADAALCQLLPMSAETSYQYLLLARAALVHDVAVTPLAVAV